MNIRRYINRRTVSRVFGADFANRLADYFPQRVPGLPPVDVLGFYSFLRDEEHGPPLSSSNRPATNTINWFVPPIGRGSGGHLNILRFVKNLEQMGFVNRIVVCDYSNTESPATIRKNIEDWFFRVDAEIYVHPAQDIPPAYHSIATGWQTAYPVRSFRSTVTRSYFVQDFEPYFYSMGSEYVFAEDTYRLGFFGITAGGWLKDKLARDYGMRTRAFGFSYDQDLYGPLQSNTRDANRRVLVYARPVTARRGFELSLFAMKRVTDILADIEVVFAGWDVSNYRLPFRHINAGAVPLEGLPRLYSECDVALVVSLTNLSLLPLELMACGCPVVSNTGENVEWLLDRTNAELRAPTGDDLAQGIVNVLSDGKRRDELVAGGFATTKATSWRKEAEVVANLLRELAH